MQYPFVLFGIVQIAHAGDLIGLALIALAFAAAAIIFAVIAIDSAANYLYHFLDRVARRNAHRSRKRLAHLAPRRHRY